jgi:hypothetical protein
MDSSVSPKDEIWFLSLYDVCRGRGEPQFVHTAAWRILLLHVSLLSGKQTSAGKVFVYL